MAGEAHFCCARDHSRDSSSWTRFPDFVFESNPKADNVKAAEAIERGMQALAAALHAIAAAVEKQRAPRPRRRKR